MDGSHFRQAVFKTYRGLSDLLSVKQHFPSKKKESPISFCLVVSLESRAMHLNTLVQEAQERVSELSIQVENEGFNLDNTEKEKQLKAWEWRYRLYRRMKTGFEHASEYKQRTSMFNWTKPWFETARPPFTDLSVSLQGHGWPLSACLEQGFWEVVKGSFVLLDFLAPDRFSGHSHEASVLLASLHHVTLI